MKLKTYTASTMAQALAQVRKELGADAMILHTRSYRTGSWLGLGGKPMVEITASSPQPKSSRKTRRVKRSTPATQRTEPVEEPMPEIVVQRSRVSQPIGQPLVQALAQQTDAPALQDLPQDEAPIDDRAALLQGLMGDAESMIRQRLGRDRLDRDQDVETQEPSVSTVRPSSSDGFEVTTFKTIGQVEEFEQSNIEQSVAKSEHAVAPSTAMPANTPESFLPEGNVPVFEMAMTPFDESVKIPTEVAGPIESDAWISTEPAAEPVVEPIVETVGKPAPQSEETQTLQSQIHTLQKMMGQVLDTTRRTAVAVNKTSPDAVLPPVEMSAPLHALYTGMIDNDVTVELADRFVGAVRDRLDTDELNDASVVRHALLREIESSIQTVSDSLLTASSSDTGPGHRPRVLALIGPTGVGKTTTVAKLAATAKLRHGKRVALITSDTYRIAAVEQLKTYASIIGLELRIANSPEEMASLIDSLNDIDLVVIDTAGRSQNNHARLDELSELIKSAQPDETHLVLSSTVGDNVLRKTAERFMPLGPDRCILTKIDEAVTTGMIAGMGDRIGLPLSFVTVGQEVPEDILSARADRLARAVLDGPSAVIPGVASGM